MQTLFWKAIRNIILFVTVFVLTLAMIGFWWSVPTSAHTPLNTGPQLQREVHQAPTPGLPEVPEPTIETRPTIVPTSPPAPTTAPNSPPPNGGGGGDSGPPSRTGRAPTPVPSGSITGTVIELNTGAPVPGLPVQVGSRIVYTDGFGNYRRDLLAAGDYRVALQIQPNLGEPAQLPLQVLVESGETTVQHLAYRGVLPGRVTATPTPTLVPNENTFESTVVEPGVETVIEVNGVLMIVSSGGVSETIILQARLVPPPSAPLANDQQLIDNPAVELIAVDRDGNELANLRFEEPLEFRFPLDPARDIVNDPPVVQYYDEEATAWIDLPTVIDTEEGTVSGFTLHLTLFVLE